MLEWLQDLLLTIDRMPALSGCNFWPSVKMMSMIESHGTPIPSTADGCLCLNVGLFLQSTMKSQRKCSFYNPRRTVIGKQNESSGLDRLDINIVETNLAFCTSPINRAAVTVCHTSVSFPGSSFCTFILILHVTVAKI